MRTTNKWVILAVCWLTWGLLFGDRMIILFMAPQIVKEFKISMTDFGLAVSALTITWALMAGVAGFLSDRFGRRSVILPSMLLFSVTTSFTGMVSGLGELLGIRALVGIGEGSYWGPGISIISDTWPEKRHGFALGFHQTGAPVLGIFLTGAITGYIALHWGWRSSFYVYGIAGFVMCLIFWALVAEPKGKAAAAGLRIGKTGTKEAWKRLLTSKGWLLNLIIMALVMITNWCVLAFLPIYLTKVKAMNIAVAGGAAGLTGLGGLFGEVVTGFSSDYIGRKRALLVPLVLVLIGIPLMLTASSMSITIASLLIIGYGINGPFPIALAIVPAETSPAELVATGVGLTMLISEVAGIIGPVAGGMVNDAYGLTASFWLAFVSAIICIILALAMRETRVDLAGAGAAN